MIHIIHLFTDVSKLNFGVWNAALFGETELAEKFQICSYTWSCNSGIDDPFPGAPHFRVLQVGEMSANGFSSLLTREFQKENTILVTHGSWKKPTELGYLAARAGFPWIYTPHGMLEPWSMKQGYLKKLVYFTFFEKRYIRHAAAARAVSKPEYERLAGKLKSPVTFIPNGVMMPSATDKPLKPIVFLFMARLHYKKGILPLVRAWYQTMTDQPQMRLVIAGPDEGELQKIQPFLGGNISYAGAVYHGEKETLLKKAHYYLLPSFSEGFPTSVVEAMSNGCIPLISKGCNFPEVFEKHLGYQAEPDEKELQSLLRSFIEKEVDTRRSLEVADFINAHYTDRSLLPAMASFYKSLL